MSAGLVDCHCLTLAQAGRFPDDTADLMNQISGRLAVLAAELEAQLAELDDLLAWSPEGSANQAPNVKGPGALVPPDC